MNLSGKRRFFIFSTPRSGTAWLSNFLTYGDCFCQHEPLINGKMEYLDYPVSGAIDTGAQIVGYSPPDDVEVFYLGRCEREIQKSLVKANLPIYNLRNYRSKDLDFEYSKLFDLAYLEILWITVTKLPFNSDRAEMLIEMNIQRNMDSLRDRFRRSL